MAESCTCLEGRTLVQIGGEYFCEYIDSIYPSCTITTCPDGYELVGGYCQIITQGLDLCPDGYTYDPNLDTCTLIEIVAATCVCTADVFASPQTICSGSATNIALASTESGIAYTWTAVQSGVMGASSGNSSVIAQTLTGLGTVTYTITPFEISSQCQGQPVEVIVTVNTVPDIIVTPSSPQAIASGATVNIAISSGLPGTTFTWTVTSPGTITGAIAGSGTTISNTLTASVAGVVTYHIQATAPNGCTTNLNYVVNVGATVTTCLAALTARVVYDGIGSQYTNATTNHSITLSGTDGSAEVRYDESHIYFIEFNVDLTQTAATFVTTHSAGLLSLGITVTSSANIINMTRTAGALSTPTFQRLDGSLIGVVTVPGGTLNPQWALSSASGHTCNRARFEFMTNGIPVGIANMNNAGGGPIPIANWDDPSTHMAAAGARQSSITYSAAEILAIGNGLPSGVGTLKIRLRGTNVLGTAPNQYYDQHSGVVGLEFFVGTTRVYQGIIGDKILEINPCNPSAAPRVLQPSTGGKSTIASALIWGAQTGTMSAGVAITTGVTKSLTVTVTSLGTGLSVGSYDIIASANGVTFRGTGVFAGTGVQTITLTALGTPLAAGTHTFTPDISSGSMVPLSFTAVTT
jgi:hypothetical protein